MENKEKRKLQANKLDKELNEAALKAAKSIYTDNKEIFDQAFKSVENKTDQQCSLKRLYKWTEVSNKIKELRFEIENICEKIENIISLENKNEPITITKARQESYRIKILHHLKEIGVSNEVIDELHKQNISR